NVGNQIMRGINLRFRDDLILPENHKLGYVVSYQYLSPKKQNASSDNLSKYIIESLKHQFIAGINYHYSQWGVQLQNRYIKRELNDGYVVSDLKVMYQFQSFQIYTQATNLFNSSYKEAAAVPMPGRWIQLGVNYHFKTKKTSN